VRIKAFVWTVAVLAMVASTAHAERVLRAGMHDDPPFVIKQANGEFTGISVGLLRLVATEMNAKLEIRDVPREEIVGGPLPDVDVVATLNVSEKMNARYELSHGFYSTGLSIAVPETPKESWVRIVARIFSGTFLWILIGVVVLLLAVGMLMWWIEKRPVQPLPKEKAALSKALFWAFEPVIGYKASQHSTRAGRVLGTIWGLFGVVLVSGLTANLAAQLTAQRLAPTVRGPEDLPRVRVGVVVHTAGRKFCDRRGIHRNEYENLDLALSALERHELDAVVADLPDLTYQTQAAHAHVQVLAGTFANHNYAFGLQPDSPIRKEFNTALLKVTYGDQWPSLLAQFLGRAD
jgi:ABC-type amino acid transport substrate-binding protein